MRIKKLNESYNKDISYYLSKFTEVHGDKYDYPDVEKFFKNSQSKINIHCKKCGNIFNQSISHHIWSKSGCRNCYGNAPNTIDKILNRSEKIHGVGRYSYPNITNEKISAFSKITILCNNCGNLFKQSVAAHLNKKNGCNRCVKSKVENLIENYLISNNIEYVSQHTFDGCVYKRNLYFDFFIPKYNLCIEYDGEQHFKSRRDSRGSHSLELQSIKDNIKNQFCLKNSINLERIIYTDNLSKKLKEILNKYGCKEIKSLNDVSILFNKKASKFCSKCKKEKILDDFNKSSRMIDGYKSYCRECSSEMCKKYYDTKNKNKK